MLDARAVADGHRHRDMGALMIGDLMASCSDAHSDITIVISSNSQQLCTAYAARCTLLSFINDDSVDIEIWNASDPGIYGSAWQTLCNAGETVIG